MVSLILIRHGQSLANKENIYTGWTDSPLTQVGVFQAIKAGEQLRNYFRGEISTYHTSVLKRAINTTYIIQEKLQDLNKPVYKNWRLNERHYGALRGLNKEKTKELYGIEQVAKWRRSYDTRPPQLPRADGNIARYRLLDKRVMPLGESLKDASKRVIPYYQDQIVPNLLLGENQMIVAHGSTIRALIKYIEDISDDDIDGVEVGNAEPIIYEFNKSLKIYSKKILK